LKVVDALSYIGKSVYFKRRFNVEDLIERMNSNGIEMAVITAPPPGPDYREANKIVYEAVKKYPERLISFYKLNPWYGREELDRAKSAVKEWNFKGLKLDPKDEGYNVNDPIVIPVMKLAEELEIPIFFQSGDSDFCPPEKILLMATSFPNVTIIMQHGGSDITPLLATHPLLCEGTRNLVLGTHPLRGSGPDGEDRLLKNLPKALEKRVVFTSEMPFGYPELELKIIELTKLNEEIKELILSENIKRILKI
jgi:predicted TIM-barrel fold metal-dependent hydrolase